MSTDVQPPKRAEMQKIARQVSDLFATSAKQEVVIAAWETLWTEKMPQVAEMLAEYAAADGPESLSPEEAEDLGHVFAVLQRTLGVTEASAAPNPDLTALWYLRRQDKMLRAICTELSIDVDRVLG